MGFRFSKLSNSGLWTLGRAAFQFILPPRCLSCDDLVADQGGLCGACWADIPFIDRPICERTGKPLAYDLGENIVSAEAIADPPVFRKMRAAARYEGTARKLIQSYKYSDRLDLTSHLARFMLRAGDDILRDTDIIMPVPLHPSRLFQRRFNQAAELAKVISQKTGKPHALQGLKRIRPTRQQTQLDLRERVKNVEGAFRVPADQTMNVYGKRILLVDDVVTTGATVSACARALLREQAVHVDVIAFAKVVEPEGITI